MNPVTDPLPSAAVWQAVEAIEDALAGAFDLPEGFRQGLTILRELCGFQGAALYLPRFCEHMPQDWTALDVPALWGLENGETHPAIATLAIGVMRSGQPVAGQLAEGEPSAGVSAVLGVDSVWPIQAGARPLGALLLHGAPAVDASVQDWQRLLRPFARLVMLHAAMSGNTSGVPGYLELMRSRNTLRAMFDSLPTSIYIIDSAYQLVAVNLSRAARAGATPRDLVGRKCYERLYQRASPCPGCLVADTFALGKNTLHVQRNWLNADTFQEWEISTYPILDERGHVIQTIVVEQDVTEKRNLESNLIQSEKLAAVGQLAAGVAHEINNPLTAIIANAQLLRQEIPPQESDLLDSVKLIEMAGTRASQVVRNLLGIARKETLDLEPVDLNESIQGAMALVQHELVGRPIHVQLDLSSDLPRVLVSHDQLQGVWINLILNAIDAIDKDPGQIHITSRALDGAIRVTVRDNGKGIPPDTLPRLFEPFFTTKQPGRGTGLGLSVSLRVIRQHGGNILVDSQPGEGTQFTVSLPATAAVSRD